MSAAAIGAMVGALSLSGAFFTVWIWVLSRLTARRIDPRWRKVWWMLLPIAFLIPLPAIHGAWPAAPHPILAATDGAASFTQRHAPAGVVFDSAWFPPAFPWFALWLSGAAGYLLLVLWRTAVLSRHWSRQRLSTDPALLDLLETCKEESGVTAPIGIVVSDRIGSPALLGWLRPRILLPTAVAAGFTPGQLRSVFFHELAHFKSLDIPLNWAFLLVRAVHWFNPLAHCAVREWNAVREEAADAAALGWLGAPSGEAEAYGAILLSTLKTGGPVPFGALAIGETIQHLKRRIHMIQTHSQRRPAPWLGGGIAVLLLALILIVPARAQEDAGAEKKAAVAAIGSWLQKEDQGNHAETWKEASPSFQKSVTQEKWIEVSRNVRQRLGGCAGRKVVSVFYQDKPMLIGDTSQTKSVTVQYESSFENMKYAVETVIFEKSGDGVWRSDGYTVRPRP